jgi:hypothetical protein
MAMAQTGEEDHHPVSDLDSVDSVNRSGESRENLFIFIKKVYDA